jgi:hypothetical protein
MSFMDFVEAVEHSSSPEGKEAPALGGYGGKKNQKSILGRTQVRYMSAMVEDPIECESVEEVFTRALQCENMLIKPGDVSIFSEATNFDKEGRFTVVIKYAELMAEDTEDKEEDHAAS